MYYLVSRIAVIVTRMGLGIFLARSTFFYRIPPFRVCVYCRASTPSFLILQLGGHGVLARALLRDSRGDHVLVAAVE